jgi:putative DNA primase/helicase
VAKQEAFDTTARLYLDELTTRYGAQPIYTGGVLYLYRDGAWTAETNLEYERHEKLLVAVCASANFPSATQLKPLQKIISVMCTPEQDTPWDSEPLLACSNGTLDLNTLELRDHSPTDYCTRSVSVPYDPSRECPEWLLMLDRVFQDHTEKDRTEAVDFLQEYFGIGIASRADHLKHRGLRKMLILVGPGGTGKSTIASMLRRFMSTEKTCTATLETLSERFGPSTLLGKQAIIADDAISKRTKANTNLLKKLVTGDEITVDRKNIAAAQYRFNGPIVFTANSMPDVSDDDTDAVYKRLVTIECTHQFTDEDRATLGHADAIQHVENVGELPGVLNWALAGYVRAVTRGSLAEPKLASSVSDATRAEQNPAYDFLKRFVVFDPQIYCRVTPIAAAVAVYANDEHNQKWSRKSSSSVVSRIVQDVCRGVKKGRVSEHGIQSRVYVGMRLLDEGKAYVALAKEKGLFVKGADTAVNERVL